ncbi:MAG: biotin/lipoyl-binding protein [Aquabacterium sp.]|nr:biotin/lipoyl-binding protein [Aquabacterium sp.]
MARHHAFVTLLGATLAAACSPARSEAGKLMVPTIQVQAQSQAAVMEWDGVIQAVRQTTVAAQVPGNITALLVKAGDSVKAGQALARIDDRDTQAALTRSQADVAQADAQLTNARQQWERSQALHAQGFISAAALDSAQAQWRPMGACHPCGHPARRRSCFPDGGVAA